MDYVKTQDGQVIEFPYSIGKFRQENSNISFPRQIPISTLNEFGIYEVIREDIPDYDRNNYNLVINNIPVKVDDNWILKWDIIEKTAEEKQDWLDSITQQMREKRTDLLRQTDWTALTDVTMSQEMIDYRQALRDITEQEGFPYNIVWPEKPVA